MKMILIKDGNNDIHYSNIIPDNFVFETISKYFPVMKLISIFIYIYFLIMSSNYRHALIVSSLEKKNGST